MKKIILLSLISVLFANCSLFADQEKANIKGICIFEGQIKLYTNADWQALADSHVTDFVIIPKEAGKYGNSAEGYKANLSPLILNTVNQLVSRRSTAKIWIGTPGISSKNFEIAPSSLAPFVEFISNLRNQIEAKVWKNNIRGIYMNQESVYGSVDYNDIMANGTIKLMNDLSSEVHKKFKKEFLWIPYYGYGSYSDEIIKKIGYVTNQKTIFDYVVIQPHYYFDKNVPQNLTGVHYCVSKQSICSTKGEIVIPKKSKTQVGAEMELSGKIVPPNNTPESLKLYNEYVASFTEFKGKSPIIFYYDGNVQNALSGRINPFFQ
ncbi:MAG: DUF4855 domain-containing protein [Bacteroidota bacterium]|nr:DUF4855 domain-containing protein [Bacteroidota bacterium]